MVLVIILIIMDLPLVILADGLIVLIKQCHIISVYIKSNQSILAKLYHHARKLVVYLSRYCSVAAQV